MGEFLSQRGELGPQLGRRDEAPLLLVCHFQGLQDFRLGVFLLHLPVHHGQEGGEV